MSSETEGPGDVVPPAPEPAGAAIDAQGSVAPQSQSRPKRRFAPATFALCAICTLVFLGIATSGAEQSWENLAAWGYLRADRVWDGAYWALLSSAFVHLALWHVAFNVYWLWIFGAAVEGKLGPIRFLGFVVASAILSSSVQLAVSGTTGYGASGFVYALFGLMWACRKRVPAIAAVLDDRTKALFWVWLVGCIVATQAGSVDVGNSAHVSGLAFGVLSAPWLISVDERRKLAIVGTSLLAVLSLIPLLWSPWSSSWVGYKAYKAHLAGNYDSAIAGYRRALALGGDRSWALENLAFAYRGKGAEKEVAATLAELRAADPAAAEKAEKELNESPPPASEKAR